MVSHTSRTAGEQFFCCCQNRLIKRLILSSSFSIILLKSLLISWSTTMLVLVIAARISLTCRSSSAHFSLRPCNASLILSVSVFYTGAFTCATLKTRLFFALVAFRKETKYSGQGGYLLSSATFWKLGPPETFVRKLLTFLQRDITYRNLMMKQVAC